MEPEKPSLFVKFENNKYEYYIRQGNEYVNFYLLPEMHEALKIAQSQAEPASQKSELSAFHPQVVEA